MQFLPSCESLLLLERDAEGGKKPDKNLHFSWQPGIIPPNNHHLHLNKGAQMAQEALAE